MFSLCNKEIYGKDDFDFEKKVAVCEDVYMDL